MTTYNYTKSDAHTEVLNREIEAETSITTSLLGISYDGTDDLNIEFDGTLSGAEETALDALVSAHDGTDINHYRVWCDQCSAVFDYWGKTFPTVCPASWCSDTNLTDVTDNDVALHGWAVRQDDQSGYYEWWIPGGDHRRYSKHRMFISYDSRLTFTPTITFGTVMYDGLSNLTLLFAGREGFVVEVTVVQVKKRFGGLNVKFTWTGVRS